MKAFGSVKKVFFIGLTILSSFTNASSFSCISMNNQACKARAQLLMLTVIIPYFILLVLKKVNVVPILIILSIHIQKIAFLIL